MSSFEFEQFGHIRPRLISGEKEDPFELTSKFLERGAALTEPVKSLVGLFDELAIFELDNY